MWERLFFQAFPCPEWFDICSNAQDKRIMSRTKFVEHGKVSVICPSINKEIGSLVGDADHTTPHYHWECEEGGANESWLQPWRWVPSSAPMWPRFVPLHKISKVYGCWCPPLLPTPAGGAPPSVPGLLPVRSAPLLIAQQRPPKVWITRNLANFITQEHLQQCNQLSSTPLSFAVRILILNLFGHVQHVKDRLTEPWHITSRVTLTLTHSRALVITGYHQGQVAGWSKAMATTESSTGHPIGLNHT